MFEGITSSIEYVRAGKLRALAVTSATRWAALPDIPAVDEFVPGYEANGWFGVGAPKNTRTEIIDTLNREINAGLADPTMKARIADLGGSSMPMTPTDFGKFIADETEKWGKVIRAANTGKKAPGRGATGYSIKTRYTRGAAPHKPRPSVQTHRTHAMTSRVLAPIRYCTPRLCAHDRTRAPGDQPQLSFR
jgi:hypothetical protein